MRQLLRSTSGAVRLGAQALSAFSIGQLRCYSPYPPFRNISSFHVSRFNTSVKYYHYNVTAVNGSTLLQWEEYCWEVRMIRLRVKEVATQKGISMTRLSRLADTNYKTIKAIFDNPYREVTTTTLDKLAKALGVAVVDLFEEVPNNSTD